MRYLLLLSVFVAGCAHQQSYMRAASGPAAACSADPYVVFVRPARSGFMQVELREGDGTFLGRVEDKSYFGVSVAPGEHFFVAHVVGHRDSRPVALRADLSPGRVYYIDVELGHGFPALYAVAPRHSYYAKLDGWLTSSHRLEPDPATGPAPLPADWVQMFNYAREWWDILGPAPLAERKLLPSDGSLGPAGLTNLSADACRERPASPGRTQVVAIGMLPTEDPDVPLCRKVILTGTHIPETRCQTPRQIEAQKESLWTWLNKPRMRPGGGG